MSKGKSASNLTSFLNQSYEIADLSTIKAHPKNVNLGASETISESIDENGFYGAIIVQRSTGLILVGNHRHAELIKKGATSGPVIFVDCDDQTADKILLVDNQSNRKGSYDETKLYTLLRDLKAADQLKGTGFGDLDVARLLQATNRTQGATQKLSDQFIAPPFSVLDAKQAYWQERKAAWLGIGIKSEIGREATSSTIAAHLSPIKAGAFTNSKVMIHGSSTIQDTSIFDPVLTELMYRWFSPPEAKILDPFAGGSVRGIVAAHTGRDYFGIDLRADQITANEEQLAEIGPGSKEGACRWIEGDSRDIDTLVAGETFDFIFSCPPYADLEVYSDDPRDLSTLEYREFIDAYVGIIKAAAAKLKDDRFACFVVGEVRGKDGNFYGFVPDTIMAFEAAGLHFYNDMILLTPIGSLPMRSGKYFRGSRKVGKAHQNVLVFLKGDIKKALKALGDFELGSMED